MVNTDDKSNASYQAALQVAQQAIADLVVWADASEQLPLHNRNAPELKVVTKAKEVFGWTKDMPIEALRLLFDLVKLSEGEGQSEEHWYPMEAIADTNPTIPYPLPKKPDLTELNRLKVQIKNEVVPVLQNEDNWKNLALLSLILEKYGSCLSFGNDNVALVDLARITGAVAAALAQNPEATHLSLVAGDLSGIQKFIYTISSEGALKSLRARSFYLELVTEEIVQQFLEKLQLPRTSIIYSGGGKFYLIASNSNQVKENITNIADRFNTWLSREFQNKIFLATGHQPFELTTVNNKSFVEAAWNPVIKLLVEQKNRKFNTQLSDLLKQRPSYEPCKVCHRDDQRQLAPLDKDEVASVSACSTCRRMFCLGEQIFRADVIVRSQKRWLSSKRIRMKTPSGATYYNLYSEENEKLPELEKGEQIFWINNWRVDNYTQQNTTPLLLSNYGKKSEESSGERAKNNGFMRAGEFAQKAANSGCIARVGYLRMDVDRLGQIFAKGLNEHYSLPRLAGLSRQMSYFFKVYLNSLAEYRRKNFLDYKNKLSFESLTDDDRSGCVSHSPERNRLQLVIEISTAMS